MRSRPHTVTFLLWTLNVALLMLVCGLLWRGSQRDALLSFTASPAVFAPPDLSTAPPIEAEGLRAQAVFHKTRSFYVPPAAPAITEPVPALQFAGSMIIPNQLPTAVLVDLQSGARSKVRSGDQVQGWTVAEVTSRGVVLQLGDRREEIPGGSGRTGSGLTVISAAPAVRVQPSTSNGVRILSSANRSTSATADVPRTPSTESPRMYQPPPP